MEPVITLLCIRKSGRRERTKLPHYTLSEARELAKWVLNAGADVYVAVAICTEEGTIETIQNPAFVYPSEVVLVEDNVGDTLLVGQALADFPTPIHLRIARDGEQALQILGEPDFKPDLIILDLNIPKISGYAVLAAHQLKKTPVVVFTASENEADEGRALSLGAQEFIRKPMNLDEYKSAVSGMVQKWAAPKQSGRRTS